MQLDLSKKRVQQMAQNLRATYPETARPSHGQALDTVASLLGYASYNALKPALTGEPARSQPCTVVIAHDRLDGETELHWVAVEAFSEEDAESEARTRFACQLLGVPFDGDGDDEVDEEVWEDTMDRVGAALVLRGHPQEVRNDAEVPPAWTVVVRTPGHDPAFRSYVELAHAEDGALSCAQTQMRIDAHDNDGPTPDAITHHLAIPGQLAPWGESLPGEPGAEHPLVILQVRGGVVQGLIADRRLRVMQVDEDELDYVSIDTAEEIEERLPVWDNPDTVLSPERVRAMGDAHTARFRETLEDILRSG